MTAKAQLTYLYGYNKPEPIPYEVKEDRLIHLQHQLKLLSEDKTLDFVRMNKVKEAIEFWERLI